MRVTRLQSPVKHQHGTVGQAHTSKQGLCRAIRRGPVPLVAEWENPQCDGGTSPRPLRRLHNGNCYGDNHQILGNRSLQDQSPKDCPISSDGQRRPLPLASSSPSFFSSESVAAFHSPSGIPLICDYLLKTPACLFNEPALANYRPEGNSKAAEGHRAHGTAYKHGPRLL